MVLRFQLLFRRKNPKRHDPLQQRQSSCLLKRNNLHRIVTISPHNPKRSPTKTKRILVPTLFPGVKIRHNQPSHPPKKANCRNLRDCRRQKIKSLPNLHLGHKKPGAPRKHQRRPQKRRLPPILLPKRATTSLRFSKFREHTPNLRVGLQTPRVKGEP